MLICRKSQTISSAVFARSSSRCRVVRELRFGFGAFSLAIEHEAFGHPSSRDIWIGLPCFVDKRPGFG
jgi:hypothetical protein